MPAATPSQPPPLPAAASVKREGQFSELAAVGRGPSQVTLNLPHGSAQPAMEPPALWNPAALGIWSFFLSWAFGSFLVAKNWRALGDNAKASRAMIWFYAFFPYILIAALTPTATAQFFRLVPMGVFVAWMLVECSPQQKLVKERFGKTYPRKSWGTPLGVAALAIGAVVALNLVAHPGLLDSGDVTAVKTGHLSAYPHSTIGEAVANFMGSPQWESGVANDGLRFVNVRGQVTYMDKPVSAVLQFEIHADGKNFEVGALEFNGVPQNNLIKLALLAKMFEGN